MHLGDSHPRIQIDWIDIQGFTLSTLIIILFKVLLVELSGPVLPQQLGGRQTMFFVVFFKVFVVMIMVMVVSVDNSWFMNDWTFFDHNFVGGGD